MVSANDRHFQRMLDVIEAARKGDASLVNVADSLHFLLSNLEGVDRPWAEKFGSHVLTLESAGLASPEQRNEMVQGLPALKVQTLDAVEALVKECMGDGQPGAGDIPDPFVAIPIR
jgi:hypothetical protein